MITFIVKPRPNSKEYFYVRIYDNQKAMLLSCYKAFGVRDVYKGITISHRMERKYRGRWRKINAIGTIALYKDYVTYGCIAHEMNHASNHYMAVKGKRFITNMKDKHWNAYDERIADMTGYMVQQFFRKYKGKISNEY